MHTNVSVYNWILYWVQWALVYCPGYKTCIPVRTGLIFLAFHAARMFKVSQCFAYFYDKYHPKQYKEHLTSG